MNELTRSERQLPDNLPELSKFVLIGRERLEAVKASIRAIDKVGLAKEVHEQKLAEAQELAEAVTDAEVRMGQLLKAIPKATKGTGANQYKPKAENMMRHDFSKSKSESIKEVGIGKQQAEHFQQMASHPEAVERAKQEARDNGQVLSRSAVLQQIAREKPKKSFIESHVERAKEQHEKHEQEKDSNVISFVAETEDRENVKTIGFSVFRELLGVVNKVHGFTITHKDNDVKTIKSYASGEDLSGLLQSIDETIRALVHIQNILRRS